MPVYNALLSSLVTNTIPETASTEETAVRGESLYVGSASIGFVESHFDVWVWPRAPNGGDISGVDTSVGVKEPGKFEEWASEGNLEVVIEVLAVPHSIGPRSSVIGQVDMYEQNMSGVNSRGEVVVEVQTVNARRNGELTL